jgi:large subunit ribosomal protein L22
LAYSYNLDRKPVVFASARDINASFKDLCSVCDALRYLPAPAAIKVLDDVIINGRPIEYRRHNKYMGSRHELGGKKGRYPIKCAQIVKKVLVNAMANAVNKGEDPEYMYVVHAAANKTYEVPRSPPKGVRAVGGNYGYTTMRRSNLEFARVEIGLADKGAKELGARMKRALKATSRRVKLLEPKVEKKPQVKVPSKPLPAPQPQKAKEVKNGGEAQAAKTNQNKV